MHVFFDPNQVLPKATLWATSHAKVIEETGMELSENLKLIAVRQGVKRPDLVRIKLVDKMPMPEDEELRRLAVETGLLGPDTMDESGQ